MENTQGNKKMTTIVVVVLIILVLILIFTLGRHKALAPVVQENNQTVQTASNSLKASSVDLNTIEVPVPTTPYISTTDGFSINFAKEPKTSNTKFNSFKSGMIPVTEYKEQFAKDSEVAYYQVSVYHYPTTYQFPEGTLSTALQAVTMVANARYPGSKIDNQSPTELLGNKAITALINVPINIDPKNPTIKVPTGDYVLITIKEHNVYIISAYGMSQNNYNKFVESFSFTK